MHIYIAVDAVGVGLAETYSHLLSDPKSRQHSNNGEKTIRPFLLQFVLGATDIEARTSASLATKHVEDSEKNPQFREDIIAMLVAENDSLSLVLNYYKTQIKNAESAWMKTEANLKSKSMSAIKLESEAEKLWGKIGSSKRKTEEIHAKGSVIAKSGYKVARCMNKRFLTGLKP